MDLKKAASRFVAEPFDDDAAAEALDETTLPTTRAGLAVGLGSIAMVTWIGALALAARIDPATGILVTMAALTVLLVVPGGIRPPDAAARRSRERVQRMHAVVHYSAYGALGILAFASMLWIPVDAWAAMSALAVVQTGYALGVVLLVVEARLDHRSADDPYTTPAMQQARSTTRVATAPQAAASAELWAAAGRTTVLSPEPAGERVESETREAT